MAGNKALVRANRAKNDEFYTQLVDVELELRHYREQFRGKVVFCNCDDPYESNFFKFFAMSFNHLGLKKLYYHLLRRESDHRRAALSARRRGRARGHT
jgi:hypothetical protein